MAEQSFYQRRIAQRHPNAQVSGDGPHGVVRLDRNEVILFADFYDARAAADVSGGQLIFINKPVACFGSSLGYREKKTATA